MLEDMAAKLCNKKKTYSLVSGQKYLAIYQSIAEFFHSLYCRGIFRLGKCAQTATSF